MAAPLIALSILCVVMLAMFLPVKRVYNDIPSLALVLWLLLANLIHAVNAIVWAGNVDIHSTVWCDITSKLLLGVNAAVPGAFLCIGRQLEMASSRRKMLDDPRIKRNSTIFEILCCFIIPLISMFLHIISQNHRFDLVGDFGCSASIHPSSPALVTIWTLPLALCTIAMVLCGLSIHHSFHRSSLAFTTHLEERSTMKPSIFFRRLATTMIVTGITAVTIIFSLFTIPALQPWTSWEAVHADLGRINIVAVDRDINNIHINWWTLFSISALYILLSLLIGEETRDSYRWLATQFSRRNQIWERFGTISFPLRRPQPLFPKSTPKTKIQVTSPPSPQMVDLKSGWDDMIDFKQPNSPTSSKRSKSPLAPLFSTQSRSQSSASTRSDFSPINTVSTNPMTAEDAAFMNSTMSYLGSPPAHALGMAATATQTPARPLPAKHIPRKEVPPLSLAIADPVLPIADLPAVHSPANIRSPVPRRSPSQPRLASVFQAEWPVPPASPSPPASAASRYDTRSPTHSVSFSIDSTLSDVPSYYRQGRPFEGAGVPSSPSASLGPHGHTRGPTLKQSLQTLRVSWEKITHGQPTTSTMVAYPGPDGIYMTVVQETV